jgi:transcriptional regulator with XRE-family HTH domain
VRARELRAEGLKYREIAEQLGVPRGTASGWCLDPDERKHRARLARYAGVCDRCHGPTSASNSRLASKTCQACREWPDEAIIAAIGGWAANHDGMPPTCTDWRIAPDGYPSTDTVVKRLGWNEALLKAGFELRMDRRPETQTEMEQMLRDGLSVREIAEHFGWSTANVYVRLKTRGLTVRDLRRAA